MKYKIGDKLKNVDNPAYDDEYYQIIDIVQDYYIYLIFRLDGSFACAENDTTSNFDDNDDIELCDAFPWEKNNFNVPVILGPKHGLMHKCTCDLKTIVNFGCKCGGI